MPMYVWIVGTLLGLLVLSVVAAGIFDRWTWKREKRLYGARSGPILPDDNAQLHARNAEIWRSGGGLP